MKKCPYCAEEIQDEAIKCKHCGEFLDGRQPPPPLPEKSALPWYFRTTPIVLVILSFPPLGLPMIWWHPKLQLSWKIGITILILFLTWLVYLSFVATMDAYKMLDEQMKAFQL